MIPSRLFARTIEEDAYVVDRRAGRIVEKAVVRRPLGQSDRSRAWRHYTQCGDRQGAPARPLWSRQERKQWGAAPAQDARPTAHAAHWARHSRQYGAGDHL